MAACGSIGLWCSMGMRYSASTLTGALRIASSGLPRGLGGGSCEGDARALAHGLRVGRVLLRVVGDLDEARGVARLLVRLGDDERHGLPVEEDPVRLERAERLVLLFRRRARRRVLRGGLRPELRRVQVREDADHARRALGLARVDRL